MSKELRHVINFSKNFFIRKLIKVHFHEALYILYINNSIGIVNGNRFGSEVPQLNISFTLKKSLLSVKYFTKMIRLENELWEVEDEKTQDRLDKGSN